MFCQNCGKQLADNAKFCSGCGQPVAREESEPAVQEPVNQPEQQSNPIPDPQQTQQETQDNQQTPPGEGQDPGPQTPPEGGSPEQTPPPPLINPPAPILSGNKHRGKAALAMLVGGAVVVVLLAVVLFNVMSSMGKGGNVYLYTTDENELMYLAGLKEDSERIELTDRGGSQVSISPDGKYIYFFEQDGDDYSSYADLYCIETSKVGKEGQKAQRVSSRVDRYHYTLMGNDQVVFLKESGGGADLYCYDGSSDFKLADDVNDFQLDGSTVYYTQMDDQDGSVTLFRMPVQEDGEAEELLSGADMLYTPMNAEPLLYGEAKENEDDWNTLYDVYSVKPGQSEELLVEDAWSVDNVSVEGGKLSFTYLLQTVEKHTLYDFVSDSYAASDAQAQQPDYQDYVIGYNSWGWEEYDWDAYYAALDNWYPVENRVYVREQLQSTDYDMTTYALHSYADGKDTTIAEGLSGIPTYEADSKIYIYEKQDREVSPVVDINDLSYYGDVYDYIYTAHGTTYQNINGVESQLDLEDWIGVMEIFPVGGGEMVLHMSGEDSAALVSCKVENNALVLGDVVEDEDYSLCYSNEDALYYFTDIDTNYTYGNLVRYQNGGATILAKDASFVYQLEDGTIFKLEDDGSLYVVKSDKEERVDDEVTNPVFLSADQLLYVSDNDLYLWQKGESVRLARDVTNVWAAESVGYDSFYLY